MNIMFYCKFGKDLEELMEQLDANPEINPG